MKKVFNFVTYALLFTAGALAVLVAYPEWFTWLPEEINKAAILVASSGFFVTGTGALVTQQLLRKSTSNNLMQFSELVGSYVKVTDVMKDSDNNNDKRIKALETKIDRLIKLQEADLQAKKSDVLIDAKTKDILDGVLNEKE